MALPVSLVSILFVAILVNVWLAFNDLEDSDRLQNEQVKPVLSQLNDGYRDLYQIMSYTTAIVLADGDPNLIRYYKTEFADELEKIGARLNAPQRLIDSGFIAPQNNAVMQKLRDDLQASLNLYEGFFELSNGYESYYVKHQLQLKSLFDEIRDGIKTLSERIEQAENKLQQEKQNYVKRTTIIMELGGLIAVILSVILTWFLSGLIIAPIQRLSRAMKDISQGDGDLTARVQVETEDEIGRLARAFNDFMEKIHRTISEVVEASQQVRNEMDNIGNVTQSISAGASEQQQESDAVATAVHEMSATSDTVSSHANEAASASQSASDEANNAKLVLGETVVSIQSLSTEIAQAGDVINTLENDVKDISSILDVIRGIADQTNLLALNAAIEAARAGEQGRGFAVVADEVRSLASKTQDSTGEIQSMIEKLQNGAQHAVKVMTSSQTNGQETVQQADIAGNSLDAIAGAISVINDMNIQIATAATQQSQVSEDVNVNVQRIAENSHQVVGIVSDAEKACKALGTQCSKLDKLVAQFKV
ncbi:methyl-accepting chemotaxis protein [Psychromonas sp. psych-6C06]|uniref:methyl-accepting chemotaxis protein n=1 Tax=Psychromonas sp. psych-6C06 TaxID=2058089 RepID=UPI00193106E0|nr:methyl-accepting chemotaxis protein [Psychromonas sp. psych-6C06]